jgi:hypothetical protein
MNTTELNFKGQNKVENRGRRGQYKRRPIKVRLILVVNATTTRGLNNKPKQSLHLPSPRRKIVPIKIRANKVRRIRNATKRENQRRYQSE